MTSAWCLTSNLPDLKPGPIILLCPKLSHLLSWNLIGLCSLKSRRTQDWAQSSCLVNTWMRDSIKQWENQCYEHRVPEAHHPCTVTSHRAAAKHREVINWSPDTQCQQVPKEASAKPGTQALSSLMLCPRVSHRSPMPPTPSEDGENTLPPLIMGPFLIWLQSLWSWSRLRNFKGKSVLELAPEGTEQDKT